MERNRRSLTRLLRTVFSVSLAGSFCAAVYLRFYSGIFPVSDLPLWTAYCLYLGSTMVVWNLVERRLLLASTVIVERWLAGWIWRLIQVSLVTLAVVSVGTFFWRGYSFSRYTVGMFWLTHLAAVGAVAAYARVWWRRRYGLPHAEVWLAGGEISDRQLDAYGCAAARSLSTRRWPSPEVLLEQLHQLVAGQRDKELLVALGTKQTPLYPAVASRLAMSQVRSGILLAAQPSEATIEGNLFLVPTDPRTTETLDYLVSKRAFDLVLAGLGLLVVSPVMALTALLIRIRLGRPVLFSQQRVGRNGVRFELHKFRTLPIGALETSDHQWTTQTPDRAMSFLRATGLDELPQLFNVLRGQMSLVGPRPERPHFVERFQNELPFYFTRHRLQVGITGWAQVNGWRGDTSIAHRVEYDLYYLNHWSLGFDLRVLARTLGGFARNVWCFARTESKTRDARTV